MSPEHLSLGLLRNKSPNSQTSGLYNFTLTYEKNKKNETIFDRIQIIYHNNSGNILNLSFEISFISLLIIMYGIQ